MGFTFAKRKLIFTMDKMMLACNFSLKRGITEPLHRRDAYDLNLFHLFRLSKSLASIIIIEATRKRQENTTKLAQ
jgi:hypothetical protein